MALFRITIIMMLVSFQAGAENFFDRPLALINQMAPSALKEKLQSCQDQEISKRFFSIGHRGAPLKFPEHTEQSYRAADKMGAGALECDVTFTKDKVLVCRHSQGDLHYTTNILETPLAEKCSVAFKPATDTHPVEVACRTSDLTHAEFLSLKGRWGKVNGQARSVEEYLQGHRGAGMLMTHAQSIALFKELEVKFVPELKRALIALPFEGFSQEDYAQSLINAYKNAGIPPKDVFVQSFNWQDILYWLAHEPAFARQALYLDGRYSEAGFDPTDPSTFEPSMTEMKAAGLNYIAPPLWMLVQSKDGQIVPSDYAKAAKAAGLKIIAWTVERSGSLKDGGGWYYQTLSDLIHNDGQVFELLDVLAQEIGVVAVFSDWPATTTYYANCMGLP